MKNKITEKWGRDLYRDRIVGAIKMQNYAWKWPMTIFKLLYGCLVWIFHVWGFVICFVVVQQQTSKWWNSDLFDIQTTHMSIYTSTFRVQFCIYCNAVAFALFCLCEDMNRIEKLTRAKNEKKNKKKSYKKCFIGFCVRLCFTYISINFDNCPFVCSL